MVKNIKKKEGEKKDEEKKDGKKKDEEKKDGENKDEENKDDEKKDGEMKDGEMKDGEMKEGDESKKTEEGDESEKKEEEEIEEEEDSNASYSIEGKEPYQSIQIKSLCYDGYKKLQKKLDNLNLEDVFYSTFCGQINHEVFAKPLLKIYGETFLEMFKHELYNCIDFNIEGKNNIICKKINEIYKKLKISFQNIVIKNELNNNLKDFRNEIILKGGAEVTVAEAKTIVRKFINTQIPKKYIKILTKIFSDSISDIFENYFHVTEEFDIYNEYVKYFDFKDENNVEGSLKKTKVTEIVSIFLSNFIKKRKGFSLFGGEGEAKEGEAKEGEGKEGEGKEGEGKEGEAKEGEGKEGEGKEGEGKEGEGKEGETKEGEMKEGEEGEEGEEGKKGEEEDKGEEASAQEISEIFIGEIYENINFDKFVKNNLSCSKIQDYVINGFEKLLKENVFKNAEEMEKILSYAFSDLMLFIYDKGIYPNNMEQDLTYKQRIIQNFVNHYPLDRLLRITREVCINNMSLLKIFRDKIANSPEISNKILKFWNSNFKELVKFFEKKKAKEMKIKETNMKDIDEITKKDLEKEDKMRNSKKLEFFKTFLDKIKPYVMKNRVVKKSGGNITKDNNKMKKNPKGGQTRKKPCKKGTRWVEKAQKCMTPDEKKQFILESRKNFKNLAHKPKEGNIGTIIESKFVPYDTNEEVK